MSHVTAVKVENPVETANEPVVAVDTALDCLTLRSQYAAAPAAVTTGRAVATAAMGAATSIAMAATAAVVAAAKAVP